jgi:hypothetical protein
MNISLSLSGHLAAAIRHPNHSTRCHRRITMQARSGKRTAVAGTAILATIAVLTFALSTSGAKNLVAAAEPVGSQILSMVAGSLDAAPTLVIALALFIAIPIISALVRATKPMTRPRNATLRYRPGRDGDMATRIDDRARTRRLMPYIEIENGPNMQCAIVRDMLRIGREDDNDIRIASRYVHRYHAAIHREDGEHWRITDLTGVESNGVIVNGRRCADARLRDGDLIQLGPGRLRFRIGAG